MPKMFDRNVLKRLLILQAPLALIVGMIVWGVYALEMKSDLETLRASERTLQYMHAEEIRQAFSMIGADLKSEASSNELRKYLETGSRQMLDALASEWMAVVRGYRTFASIMHIDERGREVLRVDLSGGAAERVDEGSLQDKSVRYYFSDTMGLESGTIYVSPFDLNVENGQIETPIKPVIRFITPVFDSKGRRRGIVLMSLLGSRFIECISSMHEKTQGVQMLLDRDGYWIIGPTPEKDWGFMYNEHNLMGLSEERPSLWDMIAKDDSGQFLAEDGLYTFSTIRPLEQGWVGRPVYEPGGVQDAMMVDAEGYYWRLVSRVPTESIDLMGRQLRSDLAMLYIALFVAFGAISWWLARLWAYRTESLAKIADAKAEWDRTFDSISDPVLLLDAEMRVKRCNAASVRLFGASFSDLVGRQCRDLICREGICEAECPCVRAVADGKSHSVEIYKGELGRHFHVSVSPVSGADLQIKGYVHYMRDITERRAVEQELMRSEASLANAQRMAHMGNWDWDMESGGLVWSSEIYRIFGLRPHEFEPTYEDFLNLVHPDDRAAVTSAVNEAIKNRQPYSINHRVVLSGGKLRHVHGQGEVIYSGDGKPVRMSGTAQDITELVHMQRELEYSESFLKSIIENEPECVKLIDEECRFISMNPAGLAMIEVDDPAQLVGQSVLPTVLPEHREAFAGFTQSVCRGKRGMLIFEVQGMKGTRRWLESHAVPFYDTRNNRTVLLGVTRDITERKRAEDALRQALTEKDMLIKEVYHRVKNNLMVIQSLLKLQQSEVHDEASRLKLEESGNRVRSMSMIHEMLYKGNDIKSIDFSVYAGNLVRNLVRGSKECAGRVKLELRIEHIPMDVDTVIPCGLILNELVTNALKYAYDNGRIGTLSVACGRNSDGLITLEVKDDGPGLPEGFEIHGSGSLGMRLVSALSAQIEAELEISNVGGASFTLRFSDAKRATD